MDKSVHILPDRRDPGELGGPEVEAFLSWQANERNMAVSTHQQALSALLFLCQRCWA